MSENTVFAYYRIFVKNMSIAEVAKELGIGQSTVVGYDTGRLPLYKVSYERLMRIVNLFGCPIDMLAENKMDRIVVNSME